MKIVHAIETDTNCNHPQELCECGYWIDNIISNTLNLVLTGGWTIPSSSQWQCDWIHRRFIAMPSSSRIDFHLILECFSASNALDVALFFRNFSQCHFCRIVLVCRPFPFTYKYVFLVLFVCIEFDCNLQVSFRSHWNIMHFLIPSVPRFTSDSLNSYFTTLQFIFTIFVYFFRKKGNVRLFFVSKVFNHCLDIYFAKGSITSHFFVLSD